MSRRTNKSSVKMYRDIQAKQQKNKCVYCSIKMKRGCKTGRPDDDVCTAEHIFPVSRGGSHEPCNIIAACFGCNQARDNYFLSLKQMYNIFKVKGRESIVPLYQEVHSRITGFLNVYIAPRMMIPC